MINLQQYFPAIMEVVKEQQRQVDKWGKQSHPEYTEHPLLPPSISVLVNPTAHNAKWICDTKHKNGKISWNDIFVEECLEACEEAKKGDIEALRKELIQVAAVCCSWIDDIDQKKGVQYPDYIGNPYHA